MHERPALIVEAPELPRDELAVSRKESRRTRWLVLIKRLAFRIGRWVAGGADVVQLEVGIRGHHDDALRVRPQAGFRQFVTG